MPGPMERQTDGNGRRDGDRGPRDWEARRRREGETRVPQQHLGGWHPRGPRGAGLVGTACSGPFRPRGSGSLTLHASRPTWRSGPNHTGQGIHRGCYPRSLTINLLDCPKLSMEAGQVRVHYAWASRERGQDARRGQEQPPLCPGASTGSPVLPRRRPQVEGRGRAR